jgi:amino-acid N-acetyltransferase
MFIEPLSATDEVIRLLAECGLPVADIEHSSSINFFGFRVDGVLAGVVGLELYQPVGLLRSLAVSPAFRGRGFARELVEFAESFCVKRNVETLFLLTTTAEEFFRRRGYLQASRAVAPDAIQSTSQFSNLCPSSAGFMSKLLV